MSETAFMVTLDDHTTSHRSFGGAAQRLAGTIGDAETIERGVQIIEFSEDDGIVLTRTWTPRMIDGEIVWTDSSRFW